MSESIITWPKIRPMVGCDKESEPQFALFQVVLCIKRKARFEVPARVDVAEVNQVLGLPPEADWSATELHLRELQRIAAASQIGVAVDSPVSQLTALSAGIKSWRDLTQEPGISRRGLALALGLPATASESQVLAELGNIYNSLHPEHEANKLADERLDYLTPLSASQRLAQSKELLSKELRSMRETLIIALCSNLPPGRAGDRIWRSAKFHVEQLAPAQILALNVELMANRANPDGSLLYRLDAGGPRSNLRASTVPGSPLARLQAGEPPTRLKLFGWGVNDSTQGRFIVNENTLATLPANQRARGYETVALDYEHNTVPGSPEYERSAEPRPVAAFGNIEVERGKGIFLSAVDWRNPEARHQYQDLSPTVGVNDLGEVTFVHSVALCRNGSVFDLTLRNAVALAAIMPAGSRVGLSPRFSILSATT